MWVWDLSERGASGQTGKQDKRNLADVEQSKHYDRKGWKVIRITCFKILAVINVREKRPLFNQVRRKLSILMNVRLNQEWKGAKRKLKIARFAIIWKISAAVALFVWLNGWTSVPKCVPRAKKFLPNCSWLTRKSLVKKGFLHLKKFEKLTIQFKPRRVCSSALDVIGCFAPFWINVAIEIPSESSTSYYSVNLILR